MRTEMREERRKTHAHDQINSIEFQAHAMDDWKISTSPDKADAQRTIAAVDK